MSAQAYRTLLREVAGRSTVAASKPRFRAHVRALFEAAAASKQSSQALDAAALNAAAFLRAQRMHQELLERYNPTISLTSEEHVAATAHRVGLRLTDEGKEKE